MLRDNEIAVGIVAYFDPNILTNPGMGITPSNSQLNRAGPFVCVQIEGTQSAWCEITSAYRPERVEILPEWRRGGSWNWNNNAQYINDCRTPYLGPTASFIQAAAAEIDFTTCARPSVTQEGIQVILTQIQLLGGQLL
ncbi:MAG TPA: hypothetical protein VF816_09320 [Rhodocyclaceae bacterium]